MKTALVIPSIREQQILQFLEAWQDQLEEADVTTYLVEDNPEKTFALEEKQYFQLHHLAWKSVPDSVLKCITTKSPACRMIGFWQAYQNEHDVIITLDDDVRPFSGTNNYFKQYADILRKGLPKWVDPLLNYRSRGYPVSNVGKMDIQCHVASFLTIPDVDGDTQLEFESDFSTNPPQYLSRPTIVPNGQYIPVNGGAFGFRREITPFIHYTMWHNDLNYFRFDDIWMGVILKKCLDLCGLNMSYGPPLVSHHRASDALKNQELEKAGKKWNEVFWEKLDEAVDSRCSIQFKGLSESWDFIATFMTEMDNLWAQQEGQQMHAWKKLFYE